VHSLAVHSLAVKFVHVEAVVGLVLVVDAVVDAVVGLVLVANS
jgi:hypothetical protein